jgi:hypothetical protein
MRVFKIWAYLFFSNGIYLKTERSSTVLPIAVLPPWFVLIALNWLVGSGDDADRYPPGHPALGITGARGQRQASKPSRAKPSSEVKGGRPVPVVVHPPRRARLLPDPVTQTAGRRSSENQGVRSIDRSELGARADVDHRIEIGGGFWRRTTGNGHGDAVQGRAAGVREGSVSDGSDQTPRLLCARG